MMTGSMLHSLLVPRKRSYIVDTKSAGGQTIVAGTRTPGRSLERELALVHHLFELERLLDLIAADHRCHFDLAVSRRDGIGLWELQEQRRGDAGFVLTKSASTDPTPAAKAAAPAAALGNRDDLNSG